MLAWSQKPQRRAATKPIAYICLGRISGTSHSFAESQQTAAACICNARRWFSTRSRSPPPPPCMQKNVTVRLIQGCRCPEGERVLPLRVCVGFHVGTVHGRVRGDRVKSVLALGDFIAASQNYLMATLSWRGGCFFEQAVALCVALSSISSTDARVNLRSWRLCLLLMQAPSSRCYEGVKNAFSSLIPSGSSAAFIHGSD